MGRQLLLKARNEGRSGAMRPRQERGGARRLPGPCWLATRPVRRVEGGKHALVRPQPLHDVERGAGETKERRLDLCILAEDVALLALPNLDEAAAVVLGKPDDRRVAAIVGAGQHQEEVAAGTFGR